jgi:cobalt transporter subunit CbtA
MLKRLAASALFAGFAAGLIVALLQLVFVVPVILEAEQYESGELIHFGSAHDHGGGEATHDHEHAEGAESGSRDLLTVLATTATFIGFGLLLTAGFGLAEGRGFAVTARSGLVWGLGGFLAFHLLPAAGLAPELPGSAAADLTARQLWWALTVACSAGGIAAIGLGRNWPVWATGIALILLPHLIGAPQAEAFAGVVPPELAGDFVGKTLAVSAAGWALLGLFAGYFWNREGAAP